MTAPPTHLRYGGAHGLSQSARPWNQTARMWTRPAVPACVKPCPKPPPPPPSAGCRAGGGGGGALSNGLRGHTTPAVQPRARFRVMSCRQTNRPVQQSRMPRAAGTVSLAPSHCRGANAAPGCRHRTRHAPAPRRHACTTLLGTAVHGCTFVYICKIGVGDFRRICKTRGCRRWNASVQYWCGRYLGSKALD